jgi:hypothetical protein
MAFNDFEWAMDNLYVPRKPKNKAEQLRELADSHESIELSRLKREFERKSTMSATSGDRSTIVDLTNTNSKSIESFINWLKSEGFAVTLSNCRNETSLEVKW